MQPCDCEVGEGRVIPFLKTFSDFTFSSLKTFLKSKWSLKNYQLLKLQKTSINLYLKLIIENC